MVIYFSFALKYSSHTMSSFHIYHTFTRFEKSISFFHVVFAFLFTYVITVPVNLVKCFVYSPAIQDNPGRPRFHEIQRDILERSCIWMGKQPGFQSSRPGSALQSHLRIRDSTRSPSSDPLLLRPSGSHSFGAQQPQGWRRLSRLAGRGRAGGVVPHGPPGRARPGVTPPAALRHHHRHLQKPRCVKQMARKKELAWPT